MSGGRPQYVGTRPMQFSTVAVVIISIFSRSIVNNRSAWLHDGGWLNVMLWCGTSACCNAVCDGNDRMSAWITAAFWTDLSETWQSLCYTTR